MPKPFDARIPHRLNPATEHEVDAARVAHELERVDRIGHNTSWLSALSREFLLHSTKLTIMLALLCHTREIALELVRHPLNQFLPNGQLNWAKCSLSPFVARLSPAPEGQYAIRLRALECRQQRSAKLVPRYLLLRRGRYR
jgi:hypothetical protein